MHGHHESPARVLVAVKQLETAMLPATLGAASCRFPHTRMVVKDHGDDAA